MLAAAEAGLDRLGDGEYWSRFVSAFGRFPQMSPANIALILDQQPAATRLRTHRGWLAVERTPIERGIAVLTASMRYKRVAGRTVWDGGRPVLEEVRHRPSTVFDYSSTAGTHLPERWSELTEDPPEGFIDDLRAAAAALGYSVESRRDAAAPSRRVFALIHGHSDREKALSLALQVGVAAGGPAGAELFSYVLCSANGLSVEQPVVSVARREAVHSARSGLRRVMQRTGFRNMEAPA